MSPSRRPSNAPCTPACVMAVGRDAWPPGLPARALTKQVDFAILSRICNHRSPHGLQGLVKNGSHFSVLQSWRFFVHFPAMTDFFCAFSFPFGKKRRREDPSGASIFFFYEVQRYRTNSAFCCRGLAAGRNPPLATVAFAFAGIPAFARPLRNNPNNGKCKSNGNQNQKNPRSDIHGDYSQKQFRVLPFRSG